MSGEKLLILVERALDRQRIAPSRFGRDAVNDPRLVFDLRRGRRLGAVNARRVHAFVAGLTAGTAQ